MLTLLKAVGHQGVNFIGLVEDSVHTQLGATQTNVCSSVVAQHNDLLICAATLAGLQNPEPGALLKKKVNDGQVPQILILGEPLPAFEFGFRRANCLDAGQLFEGVDQVLSDRGVVFDNKSLQSHLRSSHPDG